MPRFFMSSPALATVLTASLRFPRLMKTAPESVTDVSRHVLSPTELAEQRRPLELLLRHNRCMLWVDTANVEKVKETAC